MPIIVEGAACALFGSDAHLGDHDPATAASFIEALNTHAPTATHLFLLGDLFEAWIGDDGADDSAQALIACLRALVQGGVQVFVMRGNRDFLLDLPSGAFSARTGARLIEDPCALSLFGTRAVLCHGDLQCTDDLAYQRFRQLTRTPDWQRGLLSQALTARQAIARSLRTGSEASRAGRPDAMMDVNETAVAQTMRSAEATLMIHGHTHLAACHRFMLDGRAARRWVLPDWDATGRRGGLLRIDASGEARLGDWPDQQDDNRHG